VDPDLRLYVLASTNGTFSWNDTVASFDHNALKADAARDGQRGKELSVELAELGGLVQFAFYFHNPNPFTYDNENEGKAEFPMYLELLGISFRYDGGDSPCFPVENLKATNLKETQATLNWNGDGEEYGITYYPANDAAKAKTVYQDATDTELQTVTLQDLTSNTTYNVEVTSYCTKGDRTSCSMKATATFKTQRIMYEVSVNLTPEEAGTVNGESPYTAYYFEGTNVTLRASAARGYRFVAWLEGETELSKDTVYKFNITANVTYTAKFEAKPQYNLTLTASPAAGGTVEGADRYPEGDEVTVSAKANTGYRFVAWTNGSDTLSKTATYKFPMPSADVTYTAVFRDHTANEDMVRASFNVSTDHGRLSVRNLNGIMVKDIDVYTLTGNHLHHFTPNSREDLMLPLNAERALLFIRLNSEKGAAVYKVYVH
ncbi:MAG: fibronectin type III domain-containing protein, partial [Bacteroidales bacterium]|nr:fibronectin type III domain-containing protein [Bacteroidales bacterium]